MSTSSGDVTPAYATEDAFSTPQHRPMRTYADVVKEKEVCDAPVYTEKVEAKPASIRMDMASNEDHELKQLTRSETAREALVEDVMTTLPTSTKWYRGTVKKYWRKHRCGFIDCDETHELFEQDVWFCDSVPGGSDCTRNCVVFFRLREDPSNGLLPVAEKIHCRFEGKIKSFGKEKGFGFIQGAKAGSFTVSEEDIFLHQAQYVDCNVLDLVTFSVEMVRGKLQARNVRPQKESRPAMPPMSKPQESDAALQGANLCEQTFVGPMPMPVQLMPVQPMPVQPMPLQPMPVQFVLLMPAPCSL